MKIISILLTIFSATVFLYAVSIQIPASLGTHPFTGILKTPSGEVLAGVRLNFATSSAKLSTSTDEEGRFYVALPPGKYEVTTAEYFSKTFRAFVNIEDGGLNPSEVEFKIEPELKLCGAISNNDCPSLLHSIKPPYPPAALAVRASGEVLIKVKIGKDGKVESAIAESGHPLLRKASESAARSCIFQMRESDTERETKLLFVFIPGKMNEKLKYYSHPYRIVIDHVSLFVTNTVG